MSMKIRCDSCKHDGGNVCLKVGEPVTAKLYGSKKSNSCTFHEEDEGTQQVETTKSKSKSSKPKLVYDKNFWSLMYE